MACGVNSAARPLPMASSMWCYDLLVSSVAEIARHFRTLLFPPSFRERERGEGTALLVNAGRRARRKW
jgi:hypothetical protein